MAGFRPAFAGRIGHERPDLGGPTKGRSKMAGPPGKPRGR